MSQRMLIVDDSSITRSRIARAMLDPRLPGLEIIGLAKNGLEAVAIAKQCRPDLATIDLTMPEMDGITCVNSLMGTHPALNILVVSALSDKVTALTALKQGARGFLQKPFTDEALVSALLELMES